MSAKPQLPRMIEAVGTTDRIRQAYDLWSLVYARVAGPLERGPRLRALEWAGIQREDTVLEVAVGTGAIFLEILKRVDSKTRVTGVDLSPKMLQKAQRLIREKGYRNATLFQADARHLPFQAETFDVIYSSYLLDLFQLNDIGRALVEFRRVLKPGGRLVLVNLSRQDTEKISWMERFYLWLPSAWVPYLLGSCRPVFLQSFLEAWQFTEIERKFIHDLTHSEIVRARKPNS
jgi:demethylmenaquinone methyltransferase / 2-methoxy-6-polyprenyl-1,4-benzoquinol methylase